MKQILAVIFSASAIMVAGQAAAQTAYPEKSLRLVVGFPPGSQPDTVARLLGQKFAEAWGQPVVIDNAAGAAGNIAADRVAKAAQDGYTLGLLAIGLVINPSLYKLAVGPAKDFAPVSQISGSPAKNVKALVALAKAQPGGLTYASGGSGSAPHMAAELFKSMAGLDIQHIPKRRA